MSVDSLATNPICHARIKHLEIDLYFIRDKVFQQDLQVKYMPLWSTCRLFNQKPLLLLDISISGPNSM